MTSRAIAAVIFDFDGTIVDTETPVYESWAATYEHAGTDPVPLDVWAAQIGLADDESMDIRGELCRRLDVEALPDDIEAFRRATRDEMLAAQPIRAGVEAWIDTALASGVRLAIASSSPTLWVEPNLRRLGLFDRFEMLSCADPGTPGKPDPTVYRRALAAIGVDPAAGIAIEDSRPGVQAAIDAGLQCIAAPGPITVGADFGHATLQVGSLAELDPGDWF